MRCLKHSAGVLGAVVVCGVGTAVLFASSVSAESRQRTASPKAQIVQATAVDDLPDFDRMVDLDTRVERVPMLLGSLTPVGTTNIANRGPGGVCPTEVRTHSAADFSGGEFTLQAGFAQNEIAAASFVIPAGHFPITIRTMEMVFAQNHFNQTVTEWSVLVYQGTPSEANQIEEFFSDDLILPHLRLPLSGNNGANIQVTVDPSDPEQIVISSAPANTVAIGFKIVKHNNQTANPCTTQPPASSNAFPTTDNTSVPTGLAQPSQNWLRGVNCGPFGCPSNGGWSTFAALNVLCRPNGDWNIRLTYEPAGCVGACCLPSGNCAVASPTDCLNTGGVFQGSGSACTGSLCLGACCFADSQGQQCTNLSPNACTNLGGEFAGLGTACSPAICQGACCIPFFQPPNDCVDQVSQFDCEEFGGVYKNLGTTCSQIQPCFPTGGCCVGTGCTVQKESDCDNLGGTWYGPNTTCTSPGSGACCFESSSSCSNLTAANCCTFGGLYQGAGTNCTTFVCFPQGACCLQDGSCLNSIRDNVCAAQGGIFQGHNVLCSSVSCPQPSGACCASSGGCAELDEATCNGIPGAVWQGANTLCSSNPCSSIGACCASGGGCADLDAATCASIPGAVFQGPGTSCSSNPCGPQTGACCNADGSCSVNVLQSACEDCGGVYLGNGTNCSGANCTVACVADIVPPGGDGQVTIADVTSVLSAFGIPCNNCPQDIVPACGDGVVTIADINFVLTAFGPCP